MNAINEYKGYFYILRNDDVSLFENSANAKFVERKLATTKKRNKSVIIYNKISIKYLHLAKTL